LRSLWSFFINVTNLIASLWLFIGLWESRLYHFCQSHNFHGAFYSAITEMLPRSDFIDYRKFYFWNIFNIELWLCKPCHHLFLANSLCSVHMSWIKEKAKSILHQPYNFINIQWRYCWARGSHSTSSKFLSWYHGKHLSSCCLHEKKEQHECWFILALY
jgi:hypothetical protein